MIIVDDALKRKESAGRSIRIALIGAGFMGRAIAVQIMTASAGIHLAVIVARNLDAARRACREAECEWREVNTPSELRAAIASGITAITQNWRLVCGDARIEVVVEVTGSLDYAAGVVCEAIDQGKHVILMNAALGATIGPLLKRKAAARGVIYTNSDGDRPGVMMNLYRFVQGLGIRPVLCGSIKGLHDPSQNPTTQAEIARRWGQNPNVAVSAADGTEISFEQALVANATGMRVARRGMIGPRVETGTPIEKAMGLLPAKEFMHTDGIIDYVVGASPAPGVFVLGVIEHPAQRRYLALYNMGDGPLYCFYTPYLFYHFETPNSIARAALFHDATIAPLGPPCVEVVATAKRDLRRGELLDEMGWYMTYGQAENADVTHRERLLPMALAAGCRLQTDIAKDRVLTYDDVELPQNRLIDILRAEQEDAFFGKSWNAATRLNAYPEICVANAGISRAEKHSRTGDA